MVSKKCPSNLWEGLLEEWGQISADDLHKLTARMPKVCKAGITANGGLFQINVSLSNHVNALTIFSIHRHSAKKSFGK